MDNGILCRRLSLNPQLSSTGPRPVSQNTSQSVLGLASGNSLRGGGKLLKLLKISNLSVYR